MLGSGGAKWRGGGAGGWEEATGEFYQELYCGGEQDLLEHLQTADAARLATLLPSKQARATTLRPPQPAPTRRASTALRTHTRDHLDLAMLPDLSENLSNEERTWEEVMLIKGMPIPMAEKRELKARLQNATRLRLVGVQQLQWRQRVWLARARTCGGRVRRACTLWRRALQRVQGGVLAYFQLLRWLLALNFAAAFIIAAVLLLPVTLLPSPPSACTPADPASPACCSQAYLSANDSGWGLLQLVQGTGGLERTLVFYGAYTDQWLSVPRWPHWYSMQLAYACAPAACALLALLAIVRSGASQLRERLVESEGQFYRYCNVVFGGWDFSIRDERAAKIEHRALHNELEGCLHQDRRQEELGGRTRSRRVLVACARLFVHALVLVLLAAAGATIYLTLDYSQRRLQEGPSELIAALLNFAPFVVIAALNLALPEVFAQLARLESYEASELATMVRSVLLRLASLAALLWQLRTAALRRTHLQCAAANATGVLCWETYAGQQLYRLLLTDWALQLILTFLVNWPRALLARHVDNSFIRAIGKQQFQLGRHALDAIYAQAVVWLGTPYCPPLPALAALMFATTFYTKRFVCAHVSPPAPVLYRAARVKGVLMGLLLLALALSLLPIVYWVVEGTPSINCGPFRGQLSVWRAVSHYLEQLPTEVKRVGEILTSRGLVLLAAAGLLLALYYYWAVAAANRHLVRALRRQLALEGRDKQFLLQRLAAFIRQHQQRKQRRKHQQSPS